jgi:hypothetical protein
MKIGTKGPKIRFRPGTFVDMADDGNVYEVVQLYRMKDSPSDWVYRLKTVCQSYSTDGWSPDFTGHKGYHKVWSEALYKSPGSEDTPGAIWSYDREVRNQDMIRLATIRIDDILST